MQHDASTVRLAAGALLSVILFVSLAVLRFVFFPAPSRPTRSVVLLVLGDLGRSPRMMYHAQSFADAGFQTTLVGYAGSSLLPSLLSMPNFHTAALPEPPQLLTRTPRALFLATAPIKVLFQIVSILKVLLWDLQDPPEFILVQNPPSIPTLALAQLVVLVRGSHLIIDWHNLGFSILAMRLGPSHPLVRIAKVFERVFGRKAHAHLFVTNAMEDWLTKEWGLVGRKVVLHDRPPKHFHPSDSQDIHELFTRLSFKIPPAALAHLPPLPSSNATPLTFVRSSSPSSLTSGTTTPIETAHLRADRPAVLVSSTSWTADEDFTILLEALSLYEAKAKSEEEGQGLPKVLCLISGKGPGRAAFERAYEARRKSESWSYVRVWCCWVHVEDYPKMLGSADLGISLHSSSSALDLPMKIVDMYGCGLPVCSLDFACLNELVQDGSTGLVFRFAPELASHLTSLLRGFPHTDIGSSRPPSQLATLRANVARTQAERGGWRQNWDRHVRPLVVKGYGGGDGGGF